MNMKISTQEKRRIKRFLKDHKDWELTEKDCLEILPVLKKYGGLMIVELETYVQGND